jgi:hypothetical protein
MHLDRHPELNIGAIQFARHLNMNRLDRPPGIHMEFQNSSHQDNADGGILEKAEVADLVNYMRQYNIEVIPGRGAQMVRSAGSSATLMSRGEGYAQIRLPLLKYALRAVAPESDSPAEVVSKLNTLVYADLQPDMYIGLCYAIVTPGDGRLVYCNAGHAPPLLAATGMDGVTSPAIGPTARWW